MMIVKKQEIIRRKINRLIVIHIISIIRCMSIACNILCTIYTDIL